MANIEVLKVLLGISTTDKDALLNVLLQQAESDFLQYTKQTAVPVAADNIIYDMAVIRYNRYKTEGLASQSISGISENYIDGLPDNLIKALNGFRKAVFI